MDVVCYSVLRYGGVFCVVVCLFFGGGGRRRGAGDDGGGGSVFVCVCVCVCVYFSGVRACVMAEFVLQMLLQYDGPCPVL